MTSQVLHHTPLYSFSSAWHPKYCSIARSVPCTKRSRHAVVTHLQLQSCHTHAVPDQHQASCLSYRQLIHTCRQQPSRCTSAVAAAGKDGNNSTSSSSTSSSSSSGDDPSRRPNPPNRPSAWLQRLTAGLKPQQPVRLLINLLMLFFLMRIWPVGGRLGLGEGETVVVSVPFSEFIRRVKHDDVQSVAIDGLHINFSLKPHSNSLPGEHPWFVPVCYLVIHTPAWQQQSSSCLIQ